MLNTRRIERLLTVQEPDALLKALQANGMVLPLQVRMKLSQAGSAAPLALGVRRLLELSYGPTRQVRACVAKLLARQLPDGGFAGDGADEALGNTVEELAEMPPKTEPLATAAAAAALARFLRDVPQPDSRVTRAYHRALTALAQMQDAEGLLGDENDRSEADRALTSAFMLYLLAAEEPFRQAIRFAELMTWFDENELRLDSATRQLWQIARLYGTFEHKPGPAVAAAA